MPFLLILKTFEHFAKRGARTVSPPALPEAGPRGAMVLVLGLDFANSRNFLDLMLRCFRARGFAFLRFQRFAFGASEVAALWLRRSLGAP